MQPFLPPGGVFSPGLLSCNGPIAPGLAGNQPGFQALDPLVVLFDPMSGASGWADTRLAANGVLEVRLQLDRGSSCLLKVLENKTEGARWSYRRPIADPIALSGPWKLQFLEGGPELPATAELPTAGPWTALEGELFQSFSGTARYSFSFSRPSLPAGACVLDLGKVGETARVRLNGRELGVLIGPVYRLRIDQHLFQDNNLLEIEVSNLMANRIADLERKGVFWKKFYNVNFPSRLPENRGKDGLFTAEAWKPRPSGLIGPVTLTPLE